MRTLTAAEAKKQYDEYVQQLPQKWFEYAIGRVRHCINEGRCVVDDVPKECVHHVVQTLKGLGYEVYNGPKFMQLTIAWDGKKIERDIVSSLIDKGGILRCFYTSSHTQIA